LLLPEGGSTILPDGQKTILFAEDEELVRIVFAAFLRERGYNVIVAVDGVDGLEKARQHDGEIHLLLSDIAMPQMTGIELGRQLLIERPGMRVLLISAVVAAILILDDGWQFLPKPFTLQILNHRIESILNEKPEVLK
jgi:DNA-binding response OmpR family regulator